MFISVKAAQLIIIILLSIKNHVKIFLICVEQLVISFGLSG